MKTLLIASQNKGKLSELAQLLSPINIIGQDAFDIAAAEESASTFIENALIKARHASKISGLPALADDSGLVVPALNGAPGIHSARYAGEHGNDQANIQKLLTDMAPIPEQQRQASFYCAVVLMRHPDDPMPLTAFGQINGQISLSIRGHKGFGYDPVFYLPQYHCSMAELEAEQKNSISHRALALQQLKKGMVHEQIIPISI